MIFLRFSTSIFHSFSFSFTFTFPLKPRFVFLRVTFFFLASINSIKISLSYFQKSLIFSTDPTFGASFKLIFILFELIFLSLLAHEVRVQQLHTRIILDAFLVRTCFLSFVLIFDSFSSPDQMGVRDFRFLAQS